MRTLAWMWLASLAVLGACAEDAISPNPARLAQRQPFASTSASDCPACVLGPKTYVRGNSTPLTKIDSFAGDPEADYVIDIDDNSTRGADGRVVLNGQEILAPRKEGETGARHVRVPVRLLSSNSLATRLTGAPGSTLTIRIEGGVAPVGAQGGRVVSPGSKVVLTIPPGALSSEVWISVSPDTGSPPDVLLGDVLGNSIRLEPAGQSFLTPIDVRLNYGGLLPAGFPESELAIIHWDEGGLVDGITASNDVTSRTLSFQLDRFSLLTYFAACGWPKRYLTTCDGWVAYDLKWNTGSKNEVKWWVANQATNLFAKDALVASVLATWQAATSGISFVKAASSADANIIVEEVPTLSSGSDCSGGSYFPDSQFGVACFSANAKYNSWKDELDASDLVVVKLAATTITNAGGKLQYGGKSSHEIAVYNLYHELGHAIGLYHPYKRPPTGTGAPVMESTSLVPTQLHPWDVAAVQYHYGSPSGASQRQFYALCSPNRLVCFDAVISTQTAGPGQTKLSIDVRNRDDLTVVPSFIGFVAVLNVARPSNFGAGATGPAVTTIGTVGVSGVPTLIAGGFGASGYSGWAFNGFGAGPTLSGLVGCTMPSPLPNPVSGYYRTCGPSDGWVRGSLTALDDVSASDLIFYLYAFGAGSYQGVPVTGDCITDDSRLPTSYSIRRCVPAP